MSICIEYYKCVWYAYYIYHNRFVYFSLSLFRWHDIYFQILVYISFFSCFLSKNEKRNNTSECFFRVKNLWYGYLFQAWFFDILVNFWLQCKKLKRSLVTPAFIAAIGRYKKRYPDKFMTILAYAEKVSFLNSYVNKDHIFINDTERGDGPSIRNSPNCCWSVNEIYWKYKASIYFYYIWLDWLCFGCYVSSGTTLLFVNDYFLEIFWSNAWNDWWTSWKSATHETIYLAFLSPSNTWIYEVFVYQPFANFICTIFYFSNSYKSSTPYTYFFVSNSTTTISILWFFFRFKSRNYKRWNYFKFIWITSSCIFLNKLLYYVLCCVLLCKLWFSPRKSSLFCFIFSVWFYSWVGLNFGFFKKLWFLLYCVL